MTALLSSTTCMFSPEYIYATVGAESESQNGTHHRPSVAVLEEGMGSIADDARLVEEGVHVHPVSDNRMIREG